MRGARPRAPLPRFGEPPSVRPQPVLLQAVHTGHCARRRSGWGCRLLGCPGSPPWLWGRGPRVGDGVPRFEMGVLETLLGEVMEGVSVVGSGRGPVASRARSGVPTQRGAHQARLGFGTNPGWEAGSPQGESLQPEGTSCSWGGCAWKAEGEPRAGGVGNWRTCAPTPD